MLFNVYVSLSLQSLINTLFYTSLQEYSRWTSEIYRWRSSLAVGIQKLAVENLNPCPGVDTCSLSVNTCSLSINMSSSCVDMRRSLIDMRILVFYIFLCQSTWPVYVSTWGCARDVSVDMSSLLVDMSTYKKYVFQSLIFHLL